MFWCVYDFTRGETHRLRRPHWDKHNEGRFAKEIHQLRAHSTDNYSLQGHRVNTLVMINLWLYFTNHYVNARNSMKFGFVTYDNAKDAYRAIEGSTRDNTINMYDVSFGGRRAFCKSSYMDLGKAFALIYWKIRVLVFVYFLHHRWLFDRSAYGLRQTSRFGTSQRLVWRAFAQDEGKTQSETVCRCVVLIVDVVNGAHLYCHMLFIFLFFIYYFDVFIFHRQARAMAPSVANMKFRTCKLWNICNKLNHK